MGNRCWRWCTWDVQHARWEAPKLVVTVAMENTTTLGVIKGGSWFGDEKMKGIFGRVFVWKVEFAFFVEVCALVWFLTNNFLEHSVWVLPFVQWQGCCWSPSSLPSLKVCYGCWLLHSSVVLWHVHACKNVGMYRHALGRGKELFDLEFLASISDLKRYSKWLSLQMFVVNEA